MRTNVTDHAGSLSRFKNCSVGSTVGPWIRSVNGHWIFRQATTDTCAHVAPSSFLFLPKRHLTQERTCGHGQKSAMSRVQSWVVKLRQRSRQFPGVQRQLHGLIQQLLILQSLLHFTHSKFPPLESFLQRTFFAEIILSAESSGTSGLFQSVHKLSWHAWQEKVVFIIGRKRHQKLLWPSNHNSVKRHTYEKELPGRTLLRNASATHSMHYSLIHSHNLIVAFHPLALHPMANLDLLKDLTGCQMKGSCAG